MLSSSSFRVSFLSARNRRDETSLPPLAGFKCIFLRMLFTGKDFSRLFFSYTLFRLTCFVLPYILPPRFRRLLSVYVFRCTKLPLILYIAVINAVYLISLIIALSISSSTTLSSCVGPNILFTISSCQSWIISTP